MLTAMAMLAGCATRDQRIGADDGDVCRAQLVQLDSTGNYFGADIVRGAAVGAVGGALFGGLTALAMGQRGSDIAVGAGIGAVGGAAIGGTAAYFQARQQQNQDQAQLNMAIAGDLSSENAQIDRTQLAFDQLMDCRFSVAQSIRNDVASGRMTPDQGRAAMGNLRTRTQADIVVAQRINGQINGRGAQFDTAVDNVAPGAREQAVAASGARVGRSVPATPRQTVALKLRPDSAAPEVAQVPARERVTLQPASNGFTLVETSSGVRGYAPSSSFPEARALGSRPSTAQGQDGDVRSLAASNIARRDNFSESIANAERATQSQGFELAT